MHHPGLHTAIDIAGGIGTASGVTHRDTRWRSGNFDRLYTRGGVLKVKLAVVISGLGLAVSVMPLLAHHSVPAQYDVSRTITIEGVVTKIEWTNPHAHFWVEVKDADGTVSEWEMELPAPNAVMNESVKMTLPDGRVMNFPRNCGRRLL